MKVSSYTQENESKGVNIISSDPAQVFHGYEANKYNVASLKLELGQGRDPGVRSSPFVKQGEGVRRNQDDNVVTDKCYAKLGNGYAYKKIQSFRVDVVGAKQILSQYIYVQMNLLLLLISLVK